MCAIDAPILLGVQKNSESTLQNLKVLEKSKVENSRKGRSTGASNVSTVQLTLSSNANEMLTPRKILGGHALHGKYGNVRAETSSSIMPFLGVKAHHQQKPEHEVIVEILKPSVRSKKKAIQGLVSRPITSLDAGDEEGRSATPGGIDQDVSVYSEYSAASMLAHIVIPAPELLVDSRCATAARASTGCTDQVRNVVSSDPTITDSLYFHTANEQKHIITAANLPKSINENSKELVTQSKIAKSIITDASNASSFFHDWSEGPETEFNPAVLLSSSNEESSSLAAPQPPSYCRPSKTSAGDVYNGSISTPLLKRISKATSVDVKTAEKESRGAAAKNNASKFRPIPQHYLSSSDRRILEEAVRRETLGTAAIMQPEMARPDSFGIQYGALAEILAEIENKGRNIQLAAENWREMNSTFVGSIDELEAWKRELMILKSGKNRRSDSLFSSEFSELLSSNQKKKKPPHDVQIHSTLSGYMDVAPHFHWERTVKMKDKTVQQLVNEIAAHHASPGRIDVPAVVSLLPQKSHHAAVLTGSIEGPIVADVIDVPTKDKLAVFTEVCGEDVNLPAPKKVIQLPVKKKQSSWLPPDSMKKSVLGCDVVQGRDGNQIYVIHKPASIIYT